MESLGQFFKRRYGNTFLFALPIILLSIALGVASNILDALGAQQQTIDALLILSILALVLVTCVVIFSRRPLPSILGRWQRRWHNIAAWKERR